MSKSSKLRMLSDTREGLPAVAPGPYRRPALAALGLLALLLSATLNAADADAFRPPAVPLITHDPYVSVWSMADHLTDDTTRHWTGTPDSLMGLVRIDGKTYGLLGNERRVGIPPLPQTSTEVLPTRSIMQFQGEGVHLTLTFLTPALPDDLDALSRPVTYVVWTAQSADGGQHDVSLYLDAAGDMTVNDSVDPVNWSRFKLSNAEILRMSSRQQPILQKAGDDLRIDWGYLYLAAPPESGTLTAATERRSSVQEFQKSGRLPSSDSLDVELPLPARAEVLAYSAELGRIGATPVSRHVVLAYDEVFAIEYFHRRLRPYWRRNGQTAAGMLASALSDFDNFERRSEKFDSELMSDLKREGGEHYARLAALAYRQTLAAYGLGADIDGSPLYFPKENSSNGCIGTVDVIYPAAPFYLLLNPKLLEAQLRPVFEYAAMARWKFPFAPHDLGTYPLANGQVYGGGETSEENQMPVEESGNMLILTAALAHAEGNADLAKQYWPQLTKWAEYLKQKGLDPSNQLSTDDFAGHLAHNTNLSIKAIIALRSYALLCEMTGKHQEASEYSRTAENFAKQWMHLADDGDHYRLAFDQPGTWSQKYNLIWDKVLKFHLFPPAVTEKELAFYKTKINKYGLPLDNRKEYTKLDWTLWTASLGNSEADFQTFEEPAYRFANDTPDRVPLSDWYWTQNAHYEHFKARSVVGGVYIKLLTDPAMWKKWASQQH